MDKLQQSDKFLFQTNEFSLHKANGLRFTVRTGRVVNFSLIDFQPGQAAGHITSSLFHRSGCKEAPARPPRAGASSYSDANELTCRSRRIFHANLRRLTPLRSCRSRHNRRASISWRASAAAADDQLQVIRRGLDLIDGVRHAGIRADCGAWRLYVVSEARPFRGLSPERRSQNRDPVKPTRQASRFSRRFALCSGTASPSISAVV